MHWHHYTWLLPSSQIMQARLQYGGGVRRCLLTETVSLHKYRSADSTNNSHDMCPTFSNFMTFIQFRTCIMHGLHNVCNRNVKSEKATTFLVWMIPLFSDHYLTPSVTTVLLHCCKHSAILCISLLRKNMWSCFAYRCIFYQVICL